jgi:hypothetical protein
VCHLDQAESSRCAAGTCGACGLAEEVGMAGSSSLVSNRFLGPAIIGIIGSIMYTWGHNGTWAVVSNLFPPTHTQILSVEGLLTNGCNHAMRMLHFAKLLSAARSLSRHRSRSRSRSPSLSLSLSLSSSSMHLLAALCLGLLWDRSVW